MNEEIIVTNQTGDGKVYSFDVAFDLHQYKVSLSKKYWQKLTSGKITPEELVHKSFEFLLRREGPESILREFDLSQINQYFPGFEPEIKTKF